MYSRVPKSFIFMVAVLIPAQTRHVAAEDPCAGKENSSPVDQLRGMIRAYEELTRGFEVASAFIATEEQANKLADRFSLVSERTASCIFAFAKAHRDQQVAFEAFKWILANWWTSKEAAEEAIDLLRREFLKSERMSAVCLVLGSRSFIAPEGAKELLEAILEANPHREVQGRACLALARTYKGEADFFFQFGDKDRLQSTEGANPGETAFLFGLIRMGTLREAHRLLRRVIDEYADVSEDGSALGAIAQDELKRLFDPPERWTASREKK